MLFGLRFRTLGNRLVPFLISTVILRFGSFADAASVSDFIDFSYDLDSNGSVNLPGRLYVPAGYDPSKSYKLVTFLHGGGERGTDNLAQINSNINNLLKYAKQEKFFLYAPQTTGGWSGGSLEQVSNMIAKSTIDYSIDRSRLYVTGISLGGRGTWDMTSNYSGVFAGAVPISANRSDAADFGVLANSDIWAFHARDDTDATPNTSTRRMVNSIRAADGNKPPLSFPLNASTSNPYYNNGDPYYSDGSTFYAENRLRYTEYASGGHGVWSRTYNESTMYDWLLARKSAVAPPTKDAPVLLDLGATTALTTDSTGRRWNTAPSKTDHTYGPSVSFALDEGGKRTSVILEVTDTFTGAAATGTSGGTLYDAGVTTDSWYTGASTAAAAQSQKGTIVLHGLEPNAAYRLALFASHIDNDGGRGRVTRYLIGNEWRDLDIVNNLNHQAVFESIIASANGAITLTVSAAPDGNSRYGFLSAIELTAIPEPGIASIGASVLGFYLLRRLRSSIGSEDNL